MFPILDTVIGMGFVFSLLSVICSAIREALECVAMKRASALKMQLNCMLGEKTAEAIYRHPLVGSLGICPAYISPATFSLALLDLVRSGGYTSDHLEAALRALGNDRKSVEIWFNSAMDSLTRVYRRHTHFWLVVIGVLVTIVTNTDSMRILGSLAHPTELRSATVVLAQKDSATLESGAQAAGELRALGLPIGWAGETRDNSLPWKEPWTGPWWINAWLLLRWHGAGWFLTVGAISLGAPFWFDVLKRLLPLRV